MRAPQKKKNSTYRFHVFSDIFAQSLLAQDCVGSKLVAHARVQDAVHDLVHTKDVSHEDEKAPWHDTNAHTQLGAAIIGQLVLKEHNLGVE